jgi:uncharacterized membrane protein
MSYRGKRKLDESNLEGADDHIQKRANKCCENEVKRVTDMVEIAVSKMTPDERTLIYSLFQFPVISSNYQ